MQRLTLISLALIMAFTAGAGAQEKLSKPANIEKPEITKPVPKDLKSLRSDPDTRVGPGGLVKRDEGGPILGKNVNPGKGAPEGDKEAKKPSNLNTKAGQTEEEIYIGMKRTTGDEGASGPGDTLKKKSAVPDRNKQRGSSDEGGDIEDLEIQR